MLAPGSPTRGRPNRPRRVQEPDYLNRHGAGPEEKLIVRAEAGCGRQRAQSPTRMILIEGCGLRGRAVYVEVCVFVRSLTGRRRDGSKRSRQRTRCAKQPAEKFTARRISSKSSFKI